MPTIEQKIENLIALINDGMNRHMQLCYESKNEFRHQSSLGIASSMLRYRDLKESINFQMRLIEQWIRDLEKLDYELGQDVRNQVLRILNSSSIC